MPTGIPLLDHVFVIMMENHNINQILGNAIAPFINRFARSANLASNYFAIAHPSLTNYLETVGGSNFGVLTDNPRLAQCNVPSEPRDKVACNHKTGKPADLPD